MFNSQNDDQSLPSDNDTSEAFMGKGVHSEGGMRQEQSNRNKKPPGKNAKRTMASMIKHPQEFERVMNVCVGIQNAMITFMSGLGNDPNDVNDPYHFNIFKGMILGTLDQKEALEKAMAFVTEKVF